MRTVLPLLCLVFVLSATEPAHGQLRTTAHQNQTPQTQLYDQSSNVDNVLASLFGAEAFDMSHTYEASFSSFGGQTSSVGAYTNTMMWKFNSKWAARADVTLAHPLSANNNFGMGQPQIYLRNAEVTYQPSEDMHFRVQFRQSPHGRYARPFGIHRRGAFGHPFISRN